MPKVLVVDDSLSVRKVVQRALESKRIEVLSAASGSEAIEQIAREAPDLIVCDVIMPDMDGYQICDFVKKHPALGHTPVLLISVAASPAVRAALPEAHPVLRDPVLGPGTFDERTGAFVDELQRLRSEMFLDYLMLAPLSERSFELFTREVLPKLA